MTPKLTTEPALIQAVITVTRKETGNVEHYNMLVRPDGELSFVKEDPGLHLQIDSQGE